ncbi:MOSC domain-containing protein [Nocardioides donggukensis]|uniref:MOSC domain-containing protein n=1 Tax=Nocardioides donggukensis TaxID=2774019 RepID=UPI00191DD0C1|nr:MOSC N-terminal beta barrel domain-containing protein [Nocardioides donggukensis]
MSISPSDASEPSDASGPSDRSGRVVDLRRYPVKSLAGERLDAVDVETRGVRGDRLWAVREPDGRIGSGKSSRRFRRMDGLLELTARYDGDVPVVGFPDGREVAGADPDVHAALTAYVGRPVTLSREDAVSHFDDGPVHLVTTSGLAALSEARGGEVDVARFRPNLVLDTGELAGFPEDEWLGCRLQVGEAVLEVVSPMPRCVMVTLPQVGLDGDEALLRTVTDRHDTDFGVLAEVRSPGRVSLDAPWRVLGHTTDR